MKKIHLGQTYPLSLSTGAYLFLFRSGKSSQRLLVLFSGGPTPLQLEHIVSGATDQFARNKEEALPNCLNRVLVLLLIQYLFLEEVHKIVAEHQQFKPGAVSSIAVGDHLVQTKTIYPLFYEVLTC